MSKKKIILIIVAVALVVAIIVGIAAKRAADKNKPGDFQVQSIAGTDLVNNSELKLIAHRGLRAIAPENTIPAYERAGEAGYWGAECDIYRTADGVWVLSHDPDTKRMTDGNKNIEKSKLEDLQKLSIDNGNSIESYPGTKIATLDEYLDTCAALKLNPVIELKGDNNTEYYKEIIDAVNKRKLKACYISFGRKNLEALSKLDGEAQLFLLVHKITDDDINFAKELGNCGIDFNVDAKNNLKNDGEAIKKITQAKLAAGAWSVNDIETLEKLIGYGVFYITTDGITY